MVIFDQNISKSFQKVHICVDIGDFVDRFCHPYWPLCSVRLSNFLKNPPCRALYALIKDLYAYQFLNKLEFQKILQNYESIENAYLWINMVSNDTILEEEIRIYDNNAILGTVGGTLGLFLGFSFFSCGSFLLDSGTKVFNSIKHKWIKL